MKKLSIAARLLVLTLLLASLSGCAFIAQKILGLEPHYEKNIAYHAQTILLTYRHNSNRQDVQAHMDCVRSAFEKYQEKHDSEEVDRIRRDVALYFVSSDNEYYIRKKIKIDDWLKYWNGGDVLPFPQEIADRASPYKYKDFVAEYRSHPGEKAELLLQEWTRIQYEYCGAPVYSKEERCAALAAVDLAPDWCQQTETKPLTP